MKDGSFSIEHGVPGDQQESMFMNSTLSTHGDALTISIAVHPNFPPDLDTRNEAAVEEFLRQAFEPLQAQGFDIRSEEHTSELQSLMRISYAVFCLQKHNKPKANQQNLADTQKK